MIQWPRTVEVLAPIPELEADVGDFLSIDPNREPTIVVARERHVPVTELMALLTKLLIAGAITPVASPHAPQISPVSVAVGAPALPPLTRRPGAPSRPRHLSRVK